MPLNKSIIKTPRPALGRQLQKWREEQGLTKYAVAQITGMQLTQITVMEEGSKNYAIDGLLAYLAALNKSLF